MSPPADQEPYLPPGERSEILREVEQCDREAEEARRGDQEKDRQQLLICLERGLHLRRRVYGESSAQVTSACRRLCEACNIAATRMLQTENLKGAHELLKRAEQVADKSDLDRAITWNNMACYYRRMGKLRAALTYLERALVIEEHMGNADAAQTHLNLCATLSQLQRHSDARFHAQSAIIRIYEILSPVMLTGDLSLDGNPPDEGCREQVSVICIAYHNLAVEHEYLKNYEAAMCAYANGIRWAGRFLDGSHQLLGILSDAAEAVKAKLPRGSAALRRSEELMAGFSQKGATALTENTPAHLNQLMTPRDGRGQVGQGGGDSASEGSED